MLQMGGTEDNWTDSKGILCLSPFLYLEGAITKGLHWKQTGRLEGGGRQVQATSIALKDYRRFI